MQSSIINHTSSILLGLTASERWAAARRMSPRSVPEQWLVLLGVAVMLVLLVVLLAISFRRRQQHRGQWTEKFDLEALRRGLTVRERQILLAIALRGSRRHAAGIFETPDAFQRGAAQLLAEFAQTRTPQENTELKGEILRLREKLGFRAAGRGQTVRERATSRDIPAGKSIELTSDQEHIVGTIRAQVFRNDDAELSATLQTPVPSQTGDSWLVRYYAGMMAWEFRTSTVRCDGAKLTLAHSDEIRFINRRRFPRAPVRARALLAHLPLLRRDPMAAEGNAPRIADPETTGVGSTGRGEPVFVESTVTEFAGPGLRLETRLPVQAGDRVLVIVQLPSGRDGSAPARHSLSAVGRVKHGQSVERGAGIPDAIDRVWQEAPQRKSGTLAGPPLSIVVELTGLADEEIDALASLTDELSSRASDQDGNGALEPQETSDGALTPRREKRTVGLS